MDTRMDRKSSSQITTGILLIVIGLIFLGDRMHLGFGWDFGRLWPVVLIVLGVARVAQPSDRHTGGYMLVLLGVIFLLHTYGIMRLDDSWPLFIVAAGLSILFGGGRGAARARGAERAAPQDGRHDG